MCKRDVHIFLFSLDDIVCIAADIFSVNGVVISKVHKSHPVMTCFAGLGDIFWWIVKCANDGAAWGVFFSNTVTALGSIRFNGEFKSN